MQNSSLATKFCSNPVADGQDSSVPKVQEPTDNLYVSATTDAVHSLTYHKARNPATVLMLRDQEYWEIRNLEIDGGTSKPNEAVGGIHVQAANPQKSSSL